MAAMAAMLLVGAADAAFAEEGHLDSSKVAFQPSYNPSAFALIKNGRPDAVYVDPHDSDTVRLMAHTFADDLDRVGGTAASVVEADHLSPGARLVIVGTVGHSALVDDLRRRGKLDTYAIEGKWESAVTAIVQDPVPGVRQALVVAGSDRRGTAYALFTLSKLIGVSPWYWWADVPVARQRYVAIANGTYVQHEPSVRYRGIFLNDEDWGLRPWAAKRMDPKLHNIGPNTYGRICELLLRLHGNLLWPAMHPGTAAFHSVAGNAEIADRWGIVMGSSHSEALLRDNVGEWDLKKDGDWNYQTNNARMKQYWAEGLKQSAAYENEYTVGLRGLHDSGLEATGSKEVKAQLVESAMRDQRELLAGALGPRYQAAPQVIWLYKESIDLYRAGMKVPEDVTLGWTDDNYGYIRELPNAAEQQRSGGSALYYHVSYWGRPHDYLWLCTTPPALMREELTKAYDHGVRRLWVLNVGDLKPAESDIDYFLSLAWDEPMRAAETQHDFLVRWATEQFGKEAASSIAGLWGQAYALNFVSKPEFMGFNGYDDAVKHTDFNPFAWGDQGRQRLEAWQTLAQRTEAVGARLSAAAQSAYDELVGYPIGAAAAHNGKFLELDRQLIDLHRGDKAAAAADFRRSMADYERVQELTSAYNGLEKGKWNGMMLAHPRDRHVFDAPVAATAATPLPESWKAPSSAEASGQTQSRAGGMAIFREVDGTVSINAAHFSRAQDGAPARWTVLPELGISGGSVTFGAPGVTPGAPWPGKARPDAAVPQLEYRFVTASEGEATLQVYLLPTFPLDSSTGLRYAVQLDDRPPVVLDASGTERHRAGITPWEQNVLRNAAIQTLSLGALKPGEHSLRLIHGDPGVVFEHLTVTFPQAAPGYPVPPETDGTAHPTL